MQSCREVANLIASDRLEHAVWLTRLQTRLQLLFCKHCRRYAAELATIGRVGREALSADPVDPKTLQRLEQSIMADAPGRPNKGQEDVSGDPAEPTHR